MNPEFLKYGALQGEHLSKHTTFEIGGAADYFLVPSGVHELQEMLKFVSGQPLPYFILGNGSNLLVNDLGYRGVILSTKGLTSMECVDADIWAEAGVSLKDVAEFALKNHLSGLEFACGIPGSTGGGVFMNAGAYGGEMRDVVKYVQALNPLGEIRTFTCEECGFGMRKSVFQEGGWVILKICFQLVRSSFETVRQKMQEYTEMRTSKQPLEFGSAGSVFKRPEGHFAGKLIQDVGLKGLRYGNAEISSKHSGFIVNLGGASSEEVMTLIRLAQKVVFDQFGVVLEREVRLLGYED